MKDHMNEKIRLLRAIQYVCKTEIANIHPQSTEEDYVFYKSKAKQLGESLGDDCFHALASFIRTMADCGIIDLSDAPNSEQFAGKN